MKFVRMKSDEIPHNLEMYINIEMLDAYGVETDMETGNIVKVHFSSVGNDAPGELTDPESITRFLAAVGYAESDSA